MQNVTLSKKAAVPEIVDPMLPALYQITSRSQETRDTFTFTLEPNDSKGEFEFLPGQFNMLYTFGKGEVPISISGTPADLKRQVHTIRMVGMITDALGKLQVGDQVGLRGPFGSSWPVQEAVTQDVVLVAGGIGLAPLRPVIYHIFDNRSDYGKLYLLYGSRSPEDLLFFNELQQWKGRFDMEVHVIVDHAKTGWFGDVGVVTSLLKRVNCDPLDTLVMICGPEVMMRFTMKELHKMKIPKEKVYVSMERNMKCAIGLCGHCQFGSSFVCKDGPVFRFDEIEERFNKREI